MSEYDSKTKSIAAGHRSAFPIKTTRGSNPNSLPSQSTKSLLTNTMKKEVRRRIEIKRVNPSAIDLAASQDLVSRTPKAKFRAEIMELTPPEANQRATMRPNVSFPPPAPAASSETVARKSCEAVGGRKSER